MGPRVVPKRCPFCCRTPVFRAKRVRVPGSRQWKTIGIYMECRTCHTGTRVVSLADVGRSDRGNVAARAWNLVVERAETEIAAGVMATAEGGAS